MLEALKDKIHNVQQELSEGFRSIKTGRSTSVTKISVAPNFLDQFSVDAGAEILNHYQQEWYALHLAAEQNAHNADVVGLEILREETTTTQRVSSVRKFTHEIAGINQLTEELNALLTSVAAIEGLCEEVESAFAYLEVISHCQSYQEQKLEQRFQLALYREKKMAQLGEEKSRLTEAYLEKVERRARKQQVEKSEKARVLQSAIESDLKLYKSTGRVTNSLHGSAEHSDTEDASHQLEVSRKLSDVELESDPSDLEHFLSENSTEETKLSQDGTAATDGTATT